MIEVLMFPTGGNNSNAPLHALLGALEPDIRVTPFGWKRALFGKYDVLHVHWPERLLRASSPARSALVKVAFLALIARTRLTKAPVVWTVHNLRPHDGSSRLEQALLSAWTDSVLARVYLYPSAVESHRGQRSAFIPFGDFQQVLDSNPTAPSSRAVHKRMVLFGVLKRYKGIEELIEAFRRFDDAEASLRIAGRPHDAKYAQELAGLVADDSRITFTPRLLSYEELIEQVRTSELVVLPYKEMYNSGAALLALTLKRPILVPDSLTMNDLGAEVGERWVQRYTAPLTPHKLRSALTQLSRDQAPEPPDLSGRGWATVGAAYSVLYRELVSDEREE